jgi:DNA-binding NtrC family response regulator
MAERLLVIDDEPNMLRLLKTILMDKTGYTVITTNNPLEVQSLLMQEPFDLVITDLKMPLVDGIDLIDIIKKVSIQLPIIIITAYGTSEIAEDAIKKELTIYPQTFPQRGHFNCHQRPWSGNGCKRTGSAKGLN